jgi:murein DD-endopeptidase MepM/ murein hydrolase activator NlpD
MLFLILFASAVVYVSQYIITPPSSSTVKYIVVNSDDAHSNSLDSQLAIKKAQIPELYAKRLGSLQAEAIRLKAITKQLANMTGLDLSEYALDSKPAQGGIQQDGVALTDNEFNLNLSHLSDTFIEQLHQLEVMQTYIVTDDAIASTIPSRRPIDTGWLSSHYGKRIDPFDGKMAFHHGIDFAGQEGDGIHAVADGMVSWTGSKSGYGKMVEIDHGNGYVTRYAHSEKLLVDVGDMVSKDQIIALMGSTGRSTGPHVHFELLVAGHKVNPAKFTR